MEKDIEKDQSWNDTSHAFIKIHDNISKNNIINNYYYSNLNQNSIPQSFIDIYHNTSYYEYTYPQSF